MSGAGPSLFPGELPSRSVFRFPPHPAPDALPPPALDEPALRAPFHIPTDIYNSVLSYKVPLTIATVYATTVVLLNAYNRSRGNKPWAISKTRAFKAFVILHNVFLAVYSAVTCYAMFRALKASFPHYTERNAVVGTVDALCKMHGPRGLGNATIYDEQQSRWVNRNPFVHLDANGLPDATDVGRIWNEGLAFWGWWFYLSKFYEVLDTLIILAKGKRSTTLQTYHHSGAMLCMWAGMRYMSGPIWIFALVNSGIHAMMYTYYTVSALGYRVPQAIKRSLTTMQILQFILGASFAGLHLFVSYTVPVSVAYEVAEVVTSRPIAAAASLTSSAAVTTATGAAVAFLKQLVYRAAGEEGLAENIPVAGNVAHPPHGLHNEPQVVSTTRIVNRTEYQTVPCIDTSGQALAIYLNLIYLLPLTVLFVRFFVKSYIRRTSPNAKHVTKKNAITKSADDAMHGVEREIEKLGKSVEDQVDSFMDHSAVRGRDSKPNSATRIGSLSPENQKLVDQIKRKASQKLEEIGEGEEASRQRAKQMAKDIISKASGNETSEKTSNKNANQKPLDTTSGASDKKAPTKKSSGENLSYADIAKTSPEEKESDEKPSYADMASTGAGESEDSKPTGVRPRNSYDNLNREENLDVDHGVEDVEVDGAMNGRVNGQANGNSRIPKGKKTNGKS